VTVRKKWRLKMIPTFTEWPVPSMRKAYEMVAARRRDYEDGVSNIHHVKVYVDEGDGQGWQLYEEIIFPPREETQ
jgi:hypothetical protein